MTQGRFSDIMTVRTVKRMETKKESLFNPISWTILVVLRAGYFLEDLVNFKSPVRTIGDAIILVLFLIVAVGNWVKYAKSRKSGGEPLKLKTGENQRRSPVNN